MGTIADLLNTAMRDFQRYSGDGLPGEPVGRPLPVGDPASGQFNPTKKLIRDAFRALADVADGVLEPTEEALAAAEQATEAAAQAALDLVATLSARDATIAARDAIAMADYNVYYVGNQVAAGTGSEADPFNLEQALNTASASIIAPAIIYMRGGVYLDPDLRFRMDKGTVSNPIYYIAYPGELPILRSKKDVTWTKVIDEAGRNVYESVETFTSGGFGGFIKLAGEWYPLPVVSQADLEATTQDFVAGGGNYYVGPCIAEIVSGGTSKFRIRLDPPDADAQLSTLRTFATTATTNPVDYEIMLDNAGTVFLHHNHTVLDGIRFENHRLSLRVELAGDPREGLVARNCEFMPSFGCVSTGRTKGMRFDNCLFDGRMTRDWWVAYWDIKGGSAVAGGTLKSAVNIADETGEFISDNPQFTRCTFRNLFDGFVGFGINTEVGGYDPNDPNDDLKAWELGNLFENIWDDAFQIQAKAQGTKFHHNICMGAGVSRDGGSSGSDHGADWPLVYSNIFDTPDKLFYGRKGSIDGDGVQNREGMAYPPAISSHGLQVSAGAWRFSWHFIKNTLNMRLPNVLTGPNGTGVRGININIAQPGAGNYSGGKNIIANNLITLDVSEFTADKTYWVNQNLRLGRDDEIWDGNIFLGPWGEGTNYYLWRNVLDAAGTVLIAEASPDEAAANTAALALMVEDYGQRYEADGEFLPTTETSVVINPVTYQPVSGSSAATGGVDLTIIEGSIPVWVPGRGAKRRQ